METVPHTPGQRTVGQAFFKVIFLQSLLTICLLIPLAIFNSWTVALSALIGGGIAIVGSMAYAWVASINSESAAQVLRANFRAEMLKILVTLLAFAAVMLFMQWVIVPWLFVAFFVASAGYWISLLVIK
jgi:ATP synthase protein I